MTTTEGHVWRTRSHHRTHEGAVSYQSCHCGVWRVLRAGTGVAIADRIGARRHPPGAG